MVLDELLTERLGRAGIVSGRRPPGRADALRLLVEAPTDGCPSPWLRACAVWTAAREGTPTRYDLTAARAVADPVLDEQLALAGPPVSDRTPKPS